MKVIWCFGKFGFVKLGRNISEDLGLWRDWRVPAQAAVGAAFVYVSYVKSGRYVSQTSFVPDVPDAGCGRCGSLNSTLYFATLAGCGRRSPEERTTDLYKGILPAARVRICLGSHYRRNLDSVAKTSPDHHPPFGLSPQTGTSCRCQ